MDKQQWKQPGIWGAFLLGALACMATSQPRPQVSARHKEPGTTLSTKAPARYYTVTLHPSGPLAPALHKHYRKTLLGAYFVLPRSKKTGQTSLVRLRAGIAPDHAQTGFSCFRTPRACRWRTQTASNLSKESVGFSVTQEWPRATPLRTRKLFVILDLERGPSVKGELELYGSFSFRNVSEAKLKKHLSATIKVKQVTHKPTKGKTIPGHDTPEQPITTIASPTSRPTSPTSRPTTRPDPRTKAPARPAARVRPASRRPAPKRR